MAEIIKLNEYHIDAHHKIEVWMGPNDRKVYIPYFTRSGRSWMHYNAPGVSFYSSYTKSGAVAKCNPFPKRHTGMPRATDTVVEEALEIIHKEGLPLNWFTLIALIHGECTYNKLFLYMSDTYGWNEDLFLEPIYPENALQSATEGL